MIKLCLVQIARLASLVPSVSQTDKATNDAILGIHFNRTFGSSDTFFRDDLHQGNGSITVLVSLYSNAHFNSFAQTAGISISHVVLRMRDMMFCAVREFLDSPNNVR